MMNCPRTKPGINETIADEGPEDRPTESFWVDFLPSVAKFPWLVHLVWCELGLSWNFYNEGLC